MSETALSETASSDSTLDLWLRQRGLYKNPFSAWNADRDMHLPGYFVDLGQFDKLLQQTKPCVVFAGRGCGKTAQREMLAAQCRPSESNSLRLAVTYTYVGFERALIAASDDPSQLRAAHHVTALLRQGLKALEGEAERDPAVRMALTQPDVAPLLNAYLRRFAPHLVSESPAGTPNDLDDLTTLELVEGFVDLIRAANLDLVVFLVDGLDEFLLTANDSAQLVDLLAPLLGTLPLIECPGLAFKFFLPKEIEPALRACSWFRPDRVRTFRIMWKEEDLQRLIGQRLTYFSEKGDQSYTRLGQLCIDELAERIDTELAALAEGLPRAAMILADTLLHAHCEQPRPAERIGPETWAAVKAKWPALRAEFLGAQLSSPPRQQALIVDEEQSVSRSMPSPVEWPALVVDEDTGCVWLDKSEITKEINPLDYRVLACLWRHRGSVCSKDLLVREAWQGALGGVSDEAIAASISRLRKNLDQPNPHKGYIETLKGRGYRLHPEGFGS